MQNNNITDFLQLPDLDVTNIIQTEGLYIFIAQAKDKSVKCPDCGSTTDKLHDQRWQSIKDIPIRDNIVVIRLNKKRYRCNCCGKRGINDQYDSIDSYSRKTKRYDAYLTNETISKSYTTVAKENNLSYTSIDNSVKKQVDPMIEEKTSNLKNAKSISLDEFSVLKKKKYALVICDPINHELIDILPKRNKENIIEYFTSSLSKEEREQIESFVIDMWTPYKSAIEEVLPHAKIVVDKFHIVALINNALDSVRKSEQCKLGKTNRRKFYKSRLLLLKRGEDLKDEEHDKLLSLFKISPKLEKAWELKEEFRDFLQLDNIDEARAALNQWYQRVSNSKLAPFNEGKGTVKRWETEILNYFSHKITNGYTEGINNKIKLIKRTGYGVPNTNNLKRRVFNAVV